MQSKICEACNYEIQKGTEYNSQIITNIQTGKCPQETYYYKTSLKQTSLHQSCGEKVTNNYKKLKGTPSPWQNQHQIVSKLRRAISAVTKEINQKNLRRQKQNQ